MSAFKKPRLPGRINAPDVKRPGSPPPSSNQPRQPPTAPAPYRPQQKQLMQPKVADAKQRPTTVRAQPKAPPVYSPQQTPKVLQRKTAVGQEQRAPQTERRPVAPPVYRPQPGPKVLQAKSKVSSQPANQAARTPVAPPVYRPQPVPKVLQTKKAIAQPPGAGQSSGAAVAPTAHAAPARRPEQKSGAQPQMNALQRQAQPGASVSRSLSQPSRVEQNRAGVTMPNPGGRNQLAAPVIQRKFRKSDTPNEWVWENPADKSRTGRYRWLCKSVMQRADFYLDLTIVTALGLDLSTVNVAMVNTLLDHYAIVKSGGRGATPRAVGRGDVYDAEKTLIVTSLLQGYSPYETSGDIGKMAFRFSEASGELYYSSDTPPVEPSKHPKVRFVKVDSHTLEQIRERVNELEPQHYRQRVAYQNWVYVREQAEITMPERKDRSVFVWGAKKEMRSDMDDLDQEIKADILLRVSRLPRPRGSGPVIVTSELKKKGRDDGQEAAMDNINASAYALAAGESNAARTDWDWLHIRGARLGGSTTSDNLVCGTYVANSHMIPIEHDLLELSKLASREQPLIINWDATTTSRYSHMGAMITIDLRAPNGLNNGVEVILPKDAHCRWVFNPTTGAIIDRLDRDLHWGVGSVAQHYKQYQEPKQEIPWSIGSDPSMLALAPLQNQGGSLAHMHSGSVDTGSLVPFNIMALQQSPVIAEVSGRDAMAFFRSFQNPQMLLQRLNQVMLHNNLILELGTGYGMPMFFVPGTIPTFVGQVPSSGGTFFSGLLEEKSSIERHIEGRQQQRRLEYVRVHYHDPREMTADRHASIQAARQLARSLFREQKRLQ